MNIDKQRFCSYSIYETKIIQQDVKMKSLNFQFYLIYRSKSRRKDEEF